MDLILHVISIQLHRFLNFIQNLITKCNWQIFWILFLNSIELLVLNLTFYNNLLTRKVVQVANENEGILFCPALCSCTKEYISSENGQQPPSSLIKFHFSLESRKLKGKRHQSSCRQNGELLGLRCTEFYVKCTLWGGSIYVRKCEQNITNQKYEEKP